MNLDALGPAFERNKVPILAAAGAGVAGLALLKKRKAAAGSGANGAVGTAPTSSAGGFAMPASAGGQGAAMTGAAPYDSSASDLYGAVQPQLEALQNQLTRQSATPPTPVPAPPATNAAWENQAVKGWADAGYSPLDMQTALNQYLAGQAVNSAQASGIGWAVKTYGTAPQGPAGASVVVPVK